VTLIALDDGTKLSGLQRIVENDAQANPEDNDESDGSDSSDSNDD
jgi:DNA gyrase subunit A